MPLVEALNSHPYGGRRYVKGDQYEVADGDLDLMISLKRVKRVAVKTQTYQTRHMEAGIVGTRGTTTPEPQKPPEKSEVAQDAKPARRLRTRTEIKTEADQS